MEARQRSPVTGVITGLSLVFLFLPLLVVVLFSFHASAGLTFPFRGFSLRWYQQVFSSPDFRGAALNSLTVAATVAAVTLVLGTMAAYGLSRSRSRLRAPLAVLFFLPITVPGLFIGISLMVFFTGVHVKLSLTTVAAAHFVYVLPFFLLIVRAALDRLDPALEEAATNLGATPWQVFRRVTLPQIAPVLIGATCLAFALSFDEFVITFFAIGSQATLPIYIWSSIHREIDPSINVISTLTLAISLLLWVIAFLVTIRSERRRARQLVPLAPGAGP
jgi:spermidine/putrescine transport system permease protein